MNRDQWEEYLLNEYRTVSWEKIRLSHRRYLIRMRMPPRPAACPVCGAPSAQLWNCSGKYHDDLNDWKWVCRKCAQARPKPEKMPRKQEIKPWDSLTRQMQMFRIRKHLPKPAACPICKSSTLELHSLSGAWLNTPSDYVWTCRAHGRFVDSLTLLLLPFCDE